MAPEPSLTDVIQHLGASLERLGIPVSARDPWGAWLHRTRSWIDAPACVRALQFDHDAPVPGVRQAEDAVDGLARISGSYRPAPLPVVPLPRDVAPAYRAYIERVALDLSAQIRTIL